MKIVLSGLGILVVLAVAGCLVFALLVPAGDVTHFACASPAETRFPPAWGFDLMRLRGIDPNASAGLPGSPMKVVFGVASDTDWERVRPIADWLIARGGDVNRPVYGGGFHPIHEAVTSISEVRLRYLLDHGADLRLKMSPPSPGRTPLDLAQWLMERNPALTPKLKPLVVLLKERTR